MSGAATYRPTDTAMGDLDVHIVLFKRLWCELLPDHLAFGSILVKAHPTFELVIGRHLGSLELRSGELEKGRWIEIDVQSIIEVEERRGLI